MFASIRPKYTTGSVAATIAREQRAADEGLAAFYKAVPSEHRLKQVARWFDYAGPEVEPFEAYVRWGVVRVVLATVNNLDERTGCGRMRLIMTALESYYPVVDVECVGNHHLTKWLHRRGYRPVLEVGLTVHPYPCNYRMRVGQEVQPEVYHGNTLEEELSKRKST